MAESENSIFEKIKVENGNQIIDLEEDIDKYELLSLLFHKDSIPLDPSNFTANTKNDKKRYFEDTTVCYKCGQLGHVSRNCDSEDQRNCPYCDTNHKGRNCSLLLCDKCLKVGHTFRFCKERTPEPRICMKCPLQYHYSDECPRTWRKYKMIEKKSAEKLIMSCPICFSTAHFLDDCEMKDKKYTIFTKNYLKILQKDKKTKLK